MVYCLAFSPDGSILASGGEDRSLKLWNLETLRQGAGKPISPYRTFTGHGGTVRSVAFSRNGDLASGGADRTVRLWDLETGAQRATLKGHTEAVLALAFSQDGKTLASASWDRTVRLWRAAGGGEVLRGDN